MVSVEGENMRGVTWVLVEEVLSGDWAFGGNPLTTQGVKDLAHGAPQRSWFVGAPLHMSSSSSRAGGRTRPADPPSRS